MFKRKIVKVKDNRFIEKLEKFLGKEIHLGVCKGELSLKELYALRYGFGERKLDINAPSSIERITINQLFQFSTQDYITERDGYCPKEDALCVTNDWVQTITQRLLFPLSLSSKDLFIRMYIPSEDDTIIQFHNNDAHVSLLQNAFKDGEIHHIVVDDKITHELNFGEEFFAFTNFNIENSTIVIHYVP